MDGFEIVARAANGVEAEQAAADDYIDLVILDIYMPVKNGLDFLFDPRAAGNLIDVIFLTAVNDTRVINRAIKLGLFDYLIKPFSYARLKDSLENYRNFRNMLLQTSPASQEQLDSFIRTMSNAENAHFVKGLHKETLARVRDYIGRYTDVTRHIRFSA